jgi:acetyl-CoA carboxylase biotin carboxylase subunit
MNAKKSTPAPAKKARAANKRSGTSSTRKIRSVLIPNRGEISLRIVRSLKSLGIRSVVAHSEVDADSAAVHLSDDAILLGPAAPAESYLSVNRVLEAAKKSNVDALHPGYGFLSERTELVQACEDQGVIFVGPSAENIRLMGDKIAARKALTDIGIEVVPGERNPIESIEQLENTAKEIGFPVMLKAAAGGGGKGIRVVRDPSDLEAAFRLARSEAENAFNDPTMFVERYLEGSRHVEVQIVGDGAGGVRVFPERDCSTQRRHQKLLEETPCPVLDEALRDRLLGMAFEAIKISAYRGAGTLEFLFDGKNQIYFLEMNTRLQVEHPVTELITGVDLVAEQIAVAEGCQFSGKTLDDVRVVGSGAAVEFRVNAEDPLDEFRPCTGTVRELVVPGGPGIRVDTALRNNLEVTPYYDSLLAKVIAHGRDRPEALRRLRVACEEMRVGGVATTLPVALALLDDDDFMASRNHCQFLEQKLNDADFLARTPDNDLASALAIAASHLHHSGDAGARSARTAASKSSPSSTLSPWARLGRTRGLRGLER